MEGRRFWRFFLVHPGSPGKAVDRSAVKVLTTRLAQRPPPPPFKEVQKVYAVVGAFFIPLIALALLIMNGRADWVGKRGRNGWPTVILLVATLALFSWILWRKLRG